MNLDTHGRVKNPGLSQCEPDHACMFCSRYDILEGWIRLDFIALELINESFGIAQVARFIAALAIRD